MNKIRILALSALVLAALPVRPVYAGGNPALIARGLARTLFSVLEIPGGMIANAPRAFPIGLVAGTIGGTMKAVAGTIQGAVEIARGGAPYAKYAALAL